MSLMYLRLVSFLITTYIMLTIGTSITTIYDVLLDNNMDISLTVPIVQGITSILVILYDSAIIYIIKKNTNNIDMKCWDFIPKNIGIAITITVLSLSCIMHLILFHLSVTFTTIKPKNKTMLPAIYAFAILSPLCDLSTYVVIYDSMVNGYFSPQEESDPLLSSI